jgi:hypothetical protein
VASRSSRYVPRTTGLARNASLEIERRLRPGPRAGPTSGSTPVTYGPSTRRPRPWRTWVDAPRIPSKLVMQVRFTVHTPPRTSEARARAPRSAARRNSHGAAVRVKITRAERDQLAPAVNAVTSTRAGRSIAGGQRDRLAEGANQSPGRGLLFEARDASRLCASQLVRHLPEVYQSKRSCMVRHTASSS